MAHTNAFAAVSAVLIASLAFASTFAQSSPPPAAPVEDVVDEYFGVRVADPYRYMEDFKDPKVQSWVKAQAEYTEAVLAKIPGRQKLFERIKELDEGAPYQLW